MSAPMGCRAACNKWVLLQNGLLISRAAITPAFVNIQSRSKLTNKHYDPRWRRERGRKFFKVDLPDWRKLKRESNMAPDEMRAHLKKEKQVPPRTDQERNINISSTNNIFEAYVPPEGDGKASMISGKRAKQTIEQLGKKSKSFMQLRKIKQFEDDFDTATFAQEALDIYVETNNLLQDIKKNEDRLHELVSEKAYPDMIWQLQKKTFRWKFIESLEPPRVVHVRQTDMMTKDNVYGQITVRLHVKQTLAIYDRFGRLMYGSEHLQRDCLEYVVFEKHLSDTYGLWRVHGKVVPDWMPDAPPVMRTLKQAANQEAEDDEGEKGKEEKGSEVATA